MNRSAVEGVAPFRFDCLPSAGSRPGGRLTFLLRGKKVSKEARPASPVGLRPTPLRCSGRRAVFANSPQCGSDSEAGRPPPPLRCSAA
jgi:hypothetical protein